MQQLVIRDLNIEGFVHGHGHKRTPTIIKGIVNNGQKTLVIFAFENARFSNFTCELTDGVTICMRGSYWSIESFEQAVQKYLASQKEVTLTT